jgi:hypothetical protein
VLADELPFEPLVEPLAALEPLSCFAGSDEEAALDEDDGALLDPFELDEPPAALSFFSVSVADEELEVELSFFFDASIDTELEVEPAPEGAGAAELDEAEPEGDAGVVVELDEEEPADPDGVVTARLRSPSLSQPVSMPAPSARETATAKVVSFICYVLRGLGYTVEQQDSGPLQ